MSILIMHCVPSAACFPRSEDSSVWLLLEIAASKDCDAASIPARIACVVDVSGSMRSPTKYPRLQPALSGLLSTLQSHDKATLVAFSRSSFVIQQLGTPDVIQQNLASSFSALDQSPIKFAGPTNLSTGLLAAIEQLDMTAGENCIMRICCLTDGEIHDIELCKSLVANTMLTRGIELHIYGFGDGFVPGQLSSLISRSPGSCVKPLVNTSNLEQTFSHVGTQTTKAIARDARIRFRFRNQIVCGDVFQLRPAERQLGALKHRGSELTIPIIEKDRTYSFLLELRLPVTVQDITCIGVAEFSYYAASSAQRQMLRTTLAIKRDEFAAPDNPRVTRARDILLGLRDSDVAVQLRSYEARLALARLERRDPELCNALERKIISLRAIDSPQAAPSTTGHQVGSAGANKYDKDLLYLDTDISSTTALSDDDFRHETEPTIFFVLYDPRKKEKIRLPQTARVVVGRSPICNIRINFPCVSGEHCKLQVNNAELYVRDLRSRNGTFVNGQRIGEETRLECGDKLAIGSLKVVFDVLIEGLPPSE